MSDEIDEHRWTGDLGALGVRKHKPLQLDVDCGEKRFSVRITADNVITVELKSAGTYGISSVDDLNEVRSVIGYIIRRAICRGIDTCEVIESKEVARIDLGRMS